MSGRVGIYRGRLVERIKQSSSSRNRSRVKAEEPAQRSGAGDDGRSRAEVSSGDRLRRGVDGEYVSRLGGGHVRRTGARLVSRAVLDPDLLH